MSEMKHALEQYMTALNESADAVLEAAGEDQGGRVKDIVCLVINATYHSLLTGEDPKGDEFLARAIRATYSTDGFDPDEDVVDTVLGWIE